MDQSNTQSRSADAGSASNGQEVGLHLTPISKEEIYPIVSTHLGQPTDDVHHTVEFSRATEIAAGVTLTTLDGAIIGNAIVIRECRTSEMSVLTLDHMVQTGQKLWLIETDFGNQCRLSTNEIHELFGLGFQQDYDSWWDARLELIKRSVQP